MKQSSGFAATLASLCLVLSACEQAPANYPGYVEGEYLYIAAPSAGRLMQLSVQRGQQVNKDDLLFEIEREQERTQLAEAEHRLAQLRARYVDMTKGKRPEEVDQIRAQRAEAVAEASLAQSRLARSRKLFAEQSISEDALEADRSRAAQAQARVRQLDASLESAGLGARSDELEAAEQEIKLAQASLERARWAFEQQAPPAPATALVQDSFFQPGEWVPAGSPVVSLLPPAGRLVRFFVPETLVARLQTGQTAEIRCDACGEPIAARISFIAPQAEFTPPVIYSEEQRARLVFRIEARPEAADAGRLPPGLPVSVTLPATE